MPHPRRDKPPQPTVPDPQAELDAELEEGLEDSFPASDPPTAVRCEKAGPRSGVSRS